jgi:hypothetical protein
MKKLLLMAAMVLASAAPVFAQASTPPLPSCDPEALHENIQNLPQGTYCCPDGSWQLNPAPEPTFPGEEPEPPCEDAYPGHFVGDGHGSEAGADDAQYPEPNAEPNADEPEPIASPSAGEQGDNVQYNAVCQNIIGAGVAISGTLLDLYPAGPVLNMGGAKTLIAWDRLVLCELVED